MASTIEIRPYLPADLPGMVALVNRHVGAVIPNWALNEIYLERCLLSNPHQYIIDPWVVERVTLCAVAQGRLVGVTHLLRYGAHEAVAPPYRDLGDIAWLLAWPDQPDAAAQLLDAALRQLAAWWVRQIVAWDSGLPLTLMLGLATVWPHLDAAFSMAGFRPDPEREEAVFGGELGVIPHPGEPPVDGLVCRRLLRGDQGVAHVALLDDREIGWCECAADLDQGGTLPALRGWAELTELFVHEEWRGRRVVAQGDAQHTAGWLRLGGVERVALAVARDDELAGAERFYNRFGWVALTRFQDGWKRPTDNP